MLPLQELKDIRENGPFPLEMRCHYCNTLHHFTQKEIQAICCQR
jgi:molecular chaperone Hsp33